MRRTVLVGMLLVASLSGCGAGAAEVPEDEVAFEASITGTPSALVIDYSLRNGSEATLVAYNQVREGRSGAESDRVYVFRADGQVEIAKRIDHPCHDNPDLDDCSGVAPPTWRIGGTLVEPGGELTERVELPPRGRPGFIETRGQAVKFCLGVAAIGDDNPAAPDGLYPPTSPQTVFCSDPVTVAGS
jgi:hypothetical protein